jgi:CheY-like chemotaxis protein
MEQRSIREQLFRTEKVAAVGRLITGVVNELQGPIAGVINLAEQGLADGAPGRETRTLREIYSEAGRASAIVNRLVSFDRSEHAEASPTDLNRLLRSLMEFRELEWKARGIQIRNFLREGPLFVLGSRGQLEQVFLSLLVFAEQSLAEATDKVIAIGSNLLARRILVEISFTRGLAEDRDPLTAGSSGDSAALDLSVCRSIIFGHEGEIRLTRTRAAESRFEIELPWMPMDAEAGSEQPRQIREPGRQLTVLLMEPDEIVRHQLVKLLGARSYRVVPVGSAEEGLDLAQRLRFDVAFASPRLPGLNWIELLQKASAKVGAFVLLADSFESRPTAVANGQRYFILPKPIEESRLDYILDHLLDQPALPQTAPTHA